jgi:hypothetical protein
LIYANQTEIGSSIFNSDKIAVKDGPAARSAL